MNIKKLSLRNLVKKPLRTTALLFIVAFLVFSMFGGAVVVTSLQNGMNSLEARLGADVIVVPNSAKSKTNLESILLQGTPGYFYMDKSYTDKIAEIDGVEKVSAQYFLASAKSGCCSMAVQIIGFDPETDFTIKPWIQSKYNDELGLCDVVVGSDINSIVGGKIKLYDTECNVVAKLENTGTALDTAIYTNADTVRTLITAAGKQGINVLSDNSPNSVISSVYVKVMDGYDPQAVTDDINLHVRKVQAVRTKNMLTGISDSLSAISGTVTVLIIVVWIMSIIIMLIAFSMLINERKKEFAVLRVIGTSRRMLAEIIISESAVIGILGGIIGIAAASIVVFPFSSLIEENLGLPFLLPSAAQILVYIAAALSVALIAAPLSSAYSAFKLSRVDTGLILRE